MASHVSTACSPSQVGDGCTAPRIQPPFKATELSPVKKRSVLEGPRFENMVTVVGVAVCALANDATRSREAHNAAAKMSCFAIGCSILSIDCEIRTV